MPQKLDDLSRRVAGKPLQSGIESWQVDPELGAHMIPPDEWSFWPYSRWTFSHVSEYTRTARVWRGTGPILPLPRRLRDIGGIECAFSDGQRVTVAEFLEKDYTDGFLVLHRGEIVFESYMNGMEPHFKHIGRSVSKCVTGTMVGILVHRGLIDPKSLITEYLPELQATAYRGATVQHLLDQTAGATMGNGDKEFYVPHTQYYNFCIASGYFGPPEAHPSAPANTWASILGITEQEAPHGARYKYFDPNIDVLGFIMQRVSGVFLPELFSSELWGPMGAQEDACQIVDPARHAMTSGGFQATLRDWARFSLLQLRRGKLNGKQIVPSEWIDDTRAADDRLFKLHEEQPFPLNGAYHNGFRIYDQKRRDYGHTGYGGQFLYIDPQTDFAAVKLSHWPDDAEVQLLRRPDCRVTTPPFGDRLYTLEAIRAIRDKLA